MERISFAQILEKFGREPDFRFSATQEELDYDRENCGDMALEYVSYYRDQALGGCIAYGRYGDDEWVINPNSRYIIKKLMDVSLRRSQSSGKNPINAHIETSIMGDRSVIIHRKFGDHVVEQKYCTFHYHPHLTDNATTLNLATQMAQSLGHSGEVPQKPSENPLLGDIPVSISNLLIEISLKYGKTNESGQLLSGDEQCPLINAALLHTSNRNA